MEIISGSLFQKLEVQPLPCLREGIASNLRTAKFNPFDLFFPKLHSVPNCPAQCKGVEGRYLCAPRNLGRSSQRHRCSTSAASTQRFMICRIANLDVQFGRRNRWNWHCIWRLGQLCSLKVPEANHFLKIYAEFHKQHEATASALDCLMFFLQMLERLCFFLVGLHDVTKSTKQLHCIGSTIYTHCIVCPRAVSSSRNSGMTNKPTSIDWIDWERTCVLPSPVYLSESIIDSDRLYVRLDSATRKFFYRMRAGLHWGIQGGTIAIFAWIIHTNHIESYWIMKVETWTEQSQSV